MRMKFRCKNCGKIFYFHDRIVNAFVEFMRTRQKMYRVVWDKDFDSVSDMGVNKVVEINARCCDSPRIEMLEFHGYE